MAEPQMLPRAGALTRFTSPLARPPVSPANGLILAELAVPGQINLRGRSSDTGFLAAAGSVLDCRLPVSPNTVQTAGDLTVLWLGPDEWLVLTPPGAEAAIIARLREALAGVHAAVTDVSGNLTRLRLAGNHARDVLAKGCSLDLHPRRFQPGQCVQTLILRCGIILHQIDDRPSYDLLPRRSFAEYLWMWLSDAMAEYGGRAVTEY
jgi:sarcosine oxidase, subunit gamma